MKNLFKAFVMLAILAIMAPSARAQQKFTPLLDTSVNASTHNIVADVTPAVSGNYALQYIGTKISGTVAGKVYLEGTIDGTNYASPIDSLVLADQATNTKMFDVTDKRRLKWRFRIVSSGTTSFTNKGVWLENK